MTGEADLQRYRAQSPGGEGATPIASGITGTNFVDTNVTAGTQYYYQVTAVNSGMESLRSFEAMSTSGVPRRLSVSSKRSTARPWPIRPGTIPTGSRCTIRRRPPSTSPATT